MHQLTESSNKVNAQRTPKFILCMYVYVYVHLCQRKKLKRQSLNFWSNSASQIDKIQSFIFLKSFTDLFKFQQIYYIQINNESEK